MEIIAALAAGFIAGGLIFRAPNAKSEDIEYIDSKVEESMCPVEKRVYTLTVLDGKIIYVYRGKYVKHSK